MEEMSKIFPCAAAEQSPHPTNGTPFVGYPTRWGGEHLATISNLNPS